MKFIKDIKGIIFDLDGTMLDSLGMWADLDGVFLREKNISPPEGLKHAIEGLSFRETAEYFKREFYLKESVDELVQIWHDEIERIYPFLPFKNGVREFIKASLDKELKIGLATSNSFKLAHQVLSEQDYIDFFDVLVSADQVGRGKPSPDVFLEAARRMGLKPEECLVLEDTLMGVRGANRAGMTTIAIFDRYNNGRWEEIEAEADYTVENYQELLELFA